MVQSLSFRRSQVAIGALFCFLGFQYGTWVSRIPALKTHLDLSTGEVGLLLLAPGIGATISFPLVSRLMKGLGSRRLSFVSAFGLLVVLGALAFVPNLPVALAVLFVDGLLIACLNVAMNAQGAALEVTHERNTMALLHAVFSGGTFTAALIASLVTTFTTALPVHFAVAAALLLTMLVVAGTGTITTDAPAEEPVRTKRRWSLSSLAVLWLCVAMVFAELAEGAMNDWSALYLRDVAHAGTELTPLGIATVSGTMVLARLFADRWRARWGDKPVVLAGTTLAAAGLGAALLLGGWLPALIGFACVGLGMAAVAPVIYVAAAKHGPEALALVAATGTAGLLVGPPVIGLVAQATDLVWGMAVVVAAIVLIALAMTRIRVDAPDEDSPEPSPERVG
ncbi:MFS transporter [Actinoplanes sp. NBRC 103695]|uniref:MFS transporter n=1 Tax=Actinoplanes sp. NBRC 103695 TaxID=3032202 RepID=UPI0024A5AE57|nr:MFS transporter [Actinoplanes sp. NBRC 103695]GLZ01183.1 MFS transporter [Actinoplanes sp. NBRC 103695]